MLCKASAVWEPFCWSEPYSHCIRAFDHQYILVGSDKIARFMVSWFHMLMLKIRLSHLPYAKAFNFSVPISNNSGVNVAGIARSLFVYPPRKSR